MQDDKTQETYNNYCRVEELFRLQNKKMQDVAFTKRVNELSNSNYAKKQMEKHGAEQTYKSFFNFTNQFTQKENVSMDFDTKAEVIFSALVKARMRYDAIKQYGETWEKQNYNKIFEEKRNYAIKYKEKWAKTLKINFGVENQFADPSWALDKKNTDNIRNAPLKTISEGYGYIMGTN